MLIIFGGLPGTGKTTMARALAARLRAVYLRIDTIEAPIIAAYGGDVADVGYRVGYGVAEDNLRLGRTVIADSVNPLRLTRDAWRAAASRAAAASVEVEIMCSDVEEHRNRVERRTSDISRPKPPTWEQVCNREYEPWRHEHIVIDTAGRAVEDCLVELMTRLPAVVA